MTMHFIEEFGIAIGAVLAVVTIVAIIGRPIISTARTHIQGRIATEMAADRERLARIESLLEAHQLELVTMNGEMARVRQLEQTIKNGLTERTARIENSQNDMQTKLDMVLDQLRNHDHDGPN